jgi:capsular polysaccharide biosynthesis protein
VHPAHPNAGSPPIQYGKRAVDFGTKLVETIPELGVLELPDGCLYSSHAWVFGSDGHLLPEFSGLTVDRIRVPRRLHTVTRLKGVCLSLASHMASYNYGHFVLDALCRFQLFRDAGFSLADVDHVLCPRPTSPNAKRLLAALEIPESKQLWAEGNVALQADVVLATSFPGARRNYQGWAVDFLRTLVDAPSAPPNRRLFVTRVGTTRRLANEDALAPLLRQHGFERYDPTLHADPPADFGAAEIVVGPHGSGLTDLAFCRPGTRVMELIPTDHVFPYFYTLSRAAGLQYGYLMGRSRKHRRSGDYEYSPYDFRVDESEFSDAMTQIGSER